MGEPLALWSEGLIRESEPCRQLSGHPVLRISLRIPPITSPSVLKELRGDRRSAHPVAAFCCDGCTVAPPRNTPLQHFALPNTYASKKLKSKQIMGHSITMRMIVENQWWAVCA